MNVMVEASQFGSGAAGIYQRAFGDGADAACQNDLRDDIRRAFAWAIGEAPVTSIDLNGIGPTVSDKATLGPSLYAVQVSWSNNFNERGNATDFSAYIVPVDGYDENLAKEISTEGMVVTTSKVRQPGERITLNVERAGQDLNWRVANRAV